jgi:F0F1-type ATP synthase alpha subunit
MLHSYFNLEERKALGLKLKKVQKKQLLKGTSGLGLWKQRLSDLTSFEEQVILNLAFACGHLCCRFPRASVL